MEPVMSDSKNTWIYLRKSRALGDPDDPKLLEAHHSTLARLARDKEIVVPPENIIREVGSAETISGRPRFSQLLQQWERSPRDSGGVLLITEIERLSRGSLAERGRIAEALSHANVHVLTPSRRYDLRNKDDEMMFEMLLMLARRELGSYKERKALKLEELRRQGRTPNGRPPFGYVWQPKPILEFTPHPQRFPIVQAWCEEIFAMSGAQIASKWGVEEWIVYDTLHNPTICGWPARRTKLHHGEKNWQFPSMKLSREDWVWPEEPGKYPPACSRERWEQIQLVLRSRFTRRSKLLSDADGWCIDVVRFAGYEDFPVHRSSTTSYPIDDPRRYTYALKPDGKPLLYIERASIHAAAEAALHRAFRSPQVIVEALAAYRYTQSLAAMAPMGRTQDAILADRSKAEKRLQELLRRELNEDDPIQQKAIAMLRVETGNQIKQYTTELQSVLAGVEMSPAIDEFLPLLTDHLAELEDWWLDSATDPSLKRRLAALFLDCILVEVTPAPGRSYFRHIREIHYRSWLESLMRQHR
jgi:DNA invertase Pin-like site-specific DNA recombinase